MAPLRGTLGVEPVPAMPCIKYDLPKEFLDENGYEIEINPEQRCKYFHKAWKRHQGRRRNTTNAKEKNTEVNSGSSYFALSARIAAHQELIDLDKFHEAYGHTKSILGGHNNEKGFDSAYLEPEYYCGVHTQVDNWRN